MKVFVAGATGVLGRRLVQQLRTHGHEVSALARSAENERLIRSLGGEPKRADLFDADSLTRAAEGADVVIHAATAIPKEANPLGGDWTLNDRIRRKAPGTHPGCRDGRGIALPATEHPLGRSAAGRLAVRRGLAAVSERHHPLGGRRRADRP